MSMMKEVDGDDVDDAECAGLVSELRRRDGSTGRIFGLLWAGR